jgi:chromosome partitioning protein
MIKYKKENVYMGKVITVAIEKGGVGKTTTVINLAALYGMHGKSTLVVDMDPQGNCSKTLSGGKSKDEFDGHGVFDMLMSLGYSKTTDFITRTTQENVDIIPSNNSTEQIVNVLPILSQKYHKAEYVYLAACLGSVIDNYDVILIDTPSSKNSLVSSALYASDEVIIPFLTDGYSEEGMNSIYALINQLHNEAKVDIHVLGILITRVEKASSATYVRDRVKASDFAIDLFDTEIRKSVAVNDSTIFSLPVVVYDKKSTPAIDYTALYNEIQKRIG